MKTLSAHKTRSIIEKTIIESLFVKNEGTMKNKDYKKANTLQIIGKRWFQKTYGNTYHAVKIYVNDEILIKDYCYGYGSQYLQTAIELLQKAGYNINTFSDLRSIKGFTETVTDVKRKKDLIF